jgi:hypothetical protein
MPGNLALGRLEQKDLEFKAKLSYPVSKQNNKKEKKQNCILSTDKLNLMSSVKQLQYP